MLFQRYIPGENNTNEIIFHVTIGSDKKTDLIDLNPYAPTFKYIKNDENTCVFSSLAYDMFDNREHVAEKYIASQLESSLYFSLLGYLDGINFSNKIMTDRVRDKLEKYCRYNIFQ